MFALVRYTSASRSPPSRGRGLKPPKTALATRAPPVAPFAGAWIETYSGAVELDEHARRPLRGGVD